MVKGVLISDLLVQNYFLCSTFFWSVLKTLLYITEFVIDRVFIIDADRYNGNPL